MKKTSTRKAPRSGARHTAKDRLTIRHVVVPMDFSGYARQVRTCAVPLARKHRAKISLKHVVQPPAISTWRVVPGGGHYLAMDVNRLVEAAKAHLADLATAPSPGDTRGSTMVRQGNPAILIERSRNTANHKRKDTPWKRTLKPSKGRIAPSHESAC